MKSYLSVSFALWLCVASVLVAQPCADTLSVRPKVGLVLSGGGARGAAHVGVIRLIEQLQLPVDYVVGTSMGAIVGGLYAIGYTADEMDSLFMSQDWKLLLSNDLPRLQQPYAQRMARKCFQVNIPYEKGVFTENSALYRDAGIKVRRTSLQTFPKVLARPGLIDGRNLMDKFGELTSLYSDSLSYAMLPRSFACVATDLVTGREVVLREGRLAESLRASMSIPGVFYPVYQGTQVLVDGGVVNNYPVNVARAMGADVIIGVEVNSATIAARDLQSFSSIFERLIGTLGTELHERNLDDTDILISPRVKQFPVMGFDTANLRQLIDVGYLTALQSKPQLDSLKQHLDSLCDVSRDAPLRAVAGATSSGYTHSAFLDVPTNQVSLGLRLDSEEAASALLAFHVDRLQLSGVGCDLTAHLSINPWIEARLSYAWSGAPRVNIAARYSFSDVNRFYDKRNYALNYHFLGTALYLSDLFSPYYDLRVGVRHDSYSVHNLVRSDSPGASYTDTESHDSYLVPYVSLQGDRMDAAYLPTCGYAYSFNLAYHIRQRSSMGTHFAALRGSLTAAVPLGKSTTLLPSLHARHLLGRKIPLIYSNAMGGYLPHRYLQQQFPFVGFVGCEFMDRHLFVSGIELRQRLFADIYASGIINYAYSSSSLAAMGQSIWGVALQFAYDTTIGPLSLFAHWSDLYHQFGLYFSLGFEF